jgi:hypothetical protein
MSAADLSRGSVVPLANDFDASTNELGAVLL